MRGLFGLAHRAFRATLLLKGMFSAAEIVAGALFYFFDTAAIRTFIHWLTAQELTEDPSDIIARALIASTDRLSLDLQNFYAIYLVAHGALKLAVVVLLARGYLWAYPLAVAVLTGFIAYQIHRYLSEPALSLILLCLLDVAIIVLTLIEYRRAMTSANAS